MNDHQLRRDSDAFEALVTPCLDQALALAAALSPDRASAEDALQEAATKAWRHLDRLRDEKTFRCWFLKIVVSQCRSAGRGRWHLRLLPLATDQAAQQWPQSLEGDADVRRALASLSAGDRQVLAVRYLLDFG